VSITNCCFIDNNIIGNGLILIDREEDLVAATNNFVASDLSDKRCNFIAFSGVDSEFACQDADAEACTIDPAEGTPATSSCSYFASGFDLVVSVAM